MTRFVIHNHLPRRARDAGRAVSREEEERLRDEAYRQTGISRDAGSDGQLRYSENMGKWWISYKGKELGPFETPREAKAALAAEQEATKKGGSR